MSHRQYAIKPTNIDKLNARLLSVSLSKDEKDWQSVFHTHHFTELFFVVNGEGNFLFHDEKYHIRTGDLVIIPPYMEHTEQSIKGTPLEYYVIGVDGISFQPANKKTCVQVFCNFSNKSLIADLFAQMLYEVRNPSYGSDKICQDPSTYMTKECARIKEYLDINYSEPITLDTLTELTHMNKYYMAHSFAKYTGQSPIQYLNQRRMEAACTLLKDTDHSISSISSTVGFSSQSYFTQAFRKKYGMTPIKYRQQHADGSRSNAGGGI